MPIRARFPFFVTRHDVTRNILRNLGGEHGMQGGGEGRGGGERYIIRKFSTLRKILNLWISGTGEKLPPSPLSRDTNGRRRVCGVSKCSVGISLSPSLSLLPPFLPFSNRTTPRTPTTSTIAVTRNSIDPQRRRIGFSPKEVF